MIIIDNAIKVSDFIDSCGYYLNCFERPLCFLLESIIPNSCLYPILFKDFKSNYINGDFYSFLEDNTGIKILKHYMEDNDDFTNKINSMVKEKRKIILKTDLFYDHRYSNTGQYKNEHHPHYTLLKGFDTDQKSFLIFDEDPLTLNSIKKADYWPYTDIYIEEDLLKEICVNIEYSEVSESLINPNISKKYYNYFELINTNKVVEINYLDIFNTYKYVINSILDQYNNIKNIIINNITGFAKGNDLDFFSGKCPNVLKSLYVHHDSVNLQYKFFRDILRDNSVSTYLNNNFSEICRYYHNAYSLLVKFSYSKNLQNIDKAINALNIAFETEERLLEYILNNFDFIKDQSILNISCIKNVQSEHESKKSCTLASNKDSKLKQRNITENQFYIDLSEYFNNIGFGVTDRKLINKADFTGTGQFFIPEKFPWHKIYHVGNMSFKLAHIGENNADNISCMGQNILISNGLFSKLFILGCCEYGFFEGTFKIIYSNGDTVDLYVYFSDWTFAPSNGEYIAWEGFKSENQNFDYSGKVKIFAREYDILQNQQEISSIVLPDCPNMHIFAITLA